MTRRPVRGSDPQEEQDKRWGREQGGDPGAGQEAEPAGPRASSRGQPSFVAVKGF